MTERQKSIVEDMCFEIINLKKIYEGYKKQVIEGVEGLEKDPGFYTNYLVGKTEQMKASYNAYTNGLYWLNRWCNINGEEYVSLKNSLLNNKEL